VQSHFAEVDELARRYPAAVSPFAAVREHSAAAFEALENIVGDDTVALSFPERPALPRPWEIVLEIDCLQMTCDMVPVREVLPSTDMRRLNQSDVPEMLALTKLTEPGPFRERTIEMGTYLGMHAMVDGRETLIAMAGERLKMTGFTEVSAVCTHPDFRGRGYGNAMVTAVVAGIARRGETAILHVRAGNAAAVRVYERLGFFVRARTLLAAIKRA
jgi:predicted GNAT family acetyltransferase